VYIPYPSAIAGPTLTFFVWGESTLEKAHKQHCVEKKGGDNFGSRFDNNTQCCSFALVSEQQRSKHVHRDIWIHPIHHHHSSITVMVAIVVLVAAACQDTNGGETTNLIGTLGRSTVATGGDKQRILCVGRFGGIPRNRTDIGKFCTRVHRRTGIALDFQSPCTYSGEVSFEERLDPFFVGLVLLVQWVVHRVRIILVVVPPLASVPSNNIPVCVENNLASPPQS